MADRPSQTDESFKQFLEELKKQNNRSFATQLLQLKYEKETATEDADKREEQLDELINSYQKIEKAITGFDVELDIKPIVDSLGNVTEILQKHLEELTLTRKISEGSLEYDKESAQYRNTSGRDIESKVSGKTVKEGGYVDFETAADRLTGQGKRVRESEANQLKLTPIEMTAGKAATAVTGTPTKDVEPKRLSEYEVKKDDRTWSEFGKDVASEGKTLGGLGGATTGAIIGGVFGGPLGALAGGAIGGVAGKYLGGKATEKYKDYSVEKERYGTAFEKAGKGTAEEGQADYEKRIKEEKEADEAKMFGFESKKPELKPTPAKDNPEADNVETPAEIQAKAAKEDLEISKESKTIFEQQLFELKAIREALGGSEPNKSGTTSPKSQKDELPKEEESEGNLSDLIPGKKSLGKLGKAAGNFGSKAAKFLTGKGGAVLGGALAVGAGAYTAYKGFTEAEDNKQAKMEEIQAKLDSGEIDEKQAAKLREEAGNTATREKSEAAGEGTGMAAGGIAGMKAGALIGTAVGGPLGTVVGGALGGAVGMFAGSKIGKAAGGAIGSLFGGKKDSGVELPSGNVSFAYGTGTSYKKEGDKFYKDGQEISKEEFQTAYGEYKAFAKGPAKSSELLASPKTSDQKGTQVAQASTENQAMRDMASAAQPASNTIVNNVGGSKPTPNFVPMKANPRPESTLTRYQNRIAAY